MKKISKNKKYITLGFVFVLAILISPKLTSAGWTQYDYSIPYTVEVPNLPPIVNAGPDQAITLPTSSVTLTGTATDPDGTIASQLWYFRTGPVTPIISSPNASTTSITGMTVPGTYTVRFSASDNQGGSAFDAVDIVVTDEGGSSSSGSLTVSPNTCTISIGASTCTVTGATWNTTGATNPQLVDANTSSVLSTLANKATPLQVWVANPSTVFNLKDGATVLSSKTATAICASGSWWNGSVCAVTVVNGICASTHFNCNAGSSANNAGSGPWTWSCVGSGGGTTASCSEPLGGGGGDDPECSDDVDNNDVEDELKDTQDPGCHSDKDPDNNATYDPLDDSEKDVKIKEIEV